MGSDSDEKRCTCSSSSSFSVFKMFGEKAARVENFSPRRPSCSSFPSLSCLLASFFCLFFFFKPFSPPMAENGAPAADGAAADASYVLPEKWTEDTVDEKGEKISKSKGNGLTIDVRVSFFLLLSDWLQPSTTKVANKETFF